MTVPNDPTLQSSMRPGEEASEFDIVREEELQTEQAQQAEEGQQAEESSEEAAVE